MNRYIRQTLLDKMGMDGQSKLLRARVVIVGCGGLGAIAAPYLAGAGVGHLILIDGDVVDISNLHRQTIYREADKDKNKAEVLAKRLVDLNSSITIKYHQTHISKGNIQSLLSEADIVLECTDNIQAKYLINDYCHLNRIPLVYGAIHKYDGFVSIFENRDDSSITLRDIFPYPSDDIPSCSEVGVLGSIAGMIGILQANEAIKHISGIGDSLAGQLLSYDILTNSQLKLKLKKVFDEDLAEIFDSSSYEAIDCSLVPSVSITEVTNNRNDYQLISILELGEHVAVDEATIHRPLSGAKVDQLALSQNLKYVFYCKTGRRSDRLVTTILTEIDHPHVYSLEGGVDAFLNTK